MLFVPVILEDTFGCLQETIFKHHSQFLKLYPEFGVIQKMQHGTHASSHCQVCRSHMPIALSR